MRVIFLLTEYSLLIKILIYGVSQSVSQYDTHEITIIRGCIQKFPD